MLMGGARAGNGARSVRTKRWGRLRAGARARGARHRCERLIRELDLPTPTDLADVCDAVAARLGRPVRIVPIPLGGTASGLTARTADGYWIFCELRTTAWHRTHIALHELGRLLLDHGAADAPEGGTPGRYGAASREAEVLGALLMERVVSSAADRGPELTGQAAELVAALAPALRHRRAGRGGTGRAARTGGKDGAASGAGTVHTDGGSGV
ncbi:hypothetical protein [Streptomyces sp. NPDC018045]|uniref:hypothetical protein n=1 Tax=Streptomyces sp. NPDC018045 TaxID=3365037 RepID=UPI0037B47F4D